MNRLSTPRDREERHKIFGVVIGVVTNNDDPEGKYRVKVRFPWLPNGEEQGGEETYWCRIVSLMAGPDRGAFWLPEVNDEVLVAFEQGEIERPIVVGALWNGVDKVPYGNDKAKGGGEHTVRDAKGKLEIAPSGPTLDSEFCGPVEAKKNDLRFFRSRRFHQLVFNDSAKGSRVSLHSEQKHRIVLDDRDNKPTRIEIVDGKEENYIIIDTENKKITIESKTGDIFLMAKKTIHLEAEKIETVSKSNTEMKVGKSYTMTSKTMEMESSSSGTVKAGGSLTLKGSTVNIN